MRRNDEENANDEMLTNVEVMVEHYFRAAAPRRDGTGAATVLLSHRPTHKQNRQMTRTKSKRERRGKARRMHSQYRSNNPRRRARSHQRHAVLTCLANSRVSRIPNGSHRRHTRVAHAPHTQRTHAHTQDLVTRTQDLVAHAGRIESAARERRHPL